ncbi:MAG: YciI family protein [Bacteroidota bacterium]
MMRKIFPILLVFAACLTTYAQQYTFVFLNNKKDKAVLPKEEVDKIMEGHMANINRLAKEEKLVCAGPFEGGGGLFIFRSGSKKEVEEWLSTDPGVKAQRWNIEILPYTPRVGSVCAVKEPYEMTMYNFVRYEINISKDTFSDLPEAIKEHDQYLKKLASANSDVVTEAVFGTNEGGILVLKGELNNALIDQDPSVQKQVITATIKKLYIAKGAFCEK